MKVIVGLGNPGEKYKNNRHNVGFMFIDFLEDQIEQEKVFEFKKKEMFHASCFKFHDLILVKPQTFMNKSGEEVSKIIKNLKLKIENLIVAHDDLDIPLGKFKVQKGTGPLMHNGIESIEKSLQTKDFTRVRIGVDNRPLRSEGNRMNGESYVLSNFLKEELETVQNLFPILWKKVKILF